MKLAKRWYMLVAVAASAMGGAAVASNVRRSRRRDAHRRDHAMQLKSWENEGGNIAPIPAAPLVP